MIQLLVEIDGSNYYLDTLPLSPIPINYDIANVRDISSRNASYTKTFKIPDSTHNRTTLQYITINGNIKTIDPNKRIKCWVIQDTIKVLDGYLQLKGYTSNHKTGINEIEVTILGDNNNFFSDLGDLELSQINLDQYNHEYSADNIRFSWTQSVGYPYRYPLIDYGSNWTFENIAGYTSSGGGTQTVLVNEMFPAISEKLLVDIIFQQSGYNVDSEFLNGDYFKNSYIPFNGIGLPGATSSADRLFQAINSGSQSVTGDFQGGQLNLTIIEAIDFNDPNNLWDPVNFWYENKDTFALSVGFDLNFKYVPVAPTHVYTMEVKAWGSLNPDGSPNANWASGTGYMLHSFEQLQSLIPFDGTYYNWYVPIPYNVIMPTGKVRFTIQVGLYIPSFSNLVTLYTVNVSNKINPFAAAGTGFDLSFSLPKKIKQKDYIMDIARRHNLYIETSREYPNTLIIEPRDDYYAAGQIKDWSYKLDLSKDIQRKFIAEIGSRQTIFTFKDEKDYLNSLYKQTFNEIYGQEEFDSGNDFGSPTPKKIESIFGPTPLKTVDDSYRFVIPVITKDTLQSYNLDSKGKLETSPRVFQWGGLVRFEVGSPDRFSFEGEIVTDSDGFYAYPFGGHVDNPYTPTVDNQFGQPIKTYTYERDDWTDNNLFNRFWLNTMLELTNKDSELVTAYFNLNSDDINKFRFNDKIYIFYEGSGHYYKVNKIIDYDPVNPKPTKVELLKAANITVNTFIPKFVKGSQFRPTYNNSATLESLNTGFISVGPNNVNSVGAVGTTIGSNNNVGFVDAVLTNGHNNIIKDAGSDIITNGDNNEVNGFVENANTFGNDNIIGTFSTNVNTFGNNVIVGTSSSDIYNFGNNNTFIDGLTSSYIFGNNVNATQSNSIYFGGNIIFNGTVSGVGINQNLQQTLDNGNEAGGSILLMTSSNVLLGVDTNTLFTSNSSSGMLGGSSNTMASSSGSALIGGTVISITSSTGAVILGGRDNSLASSTYTIAAGRQVYGTSSFAESLFGRFIYSNTSTYNIVGGNTLNITASNYNLLVGQSNRMQSVNRSIMGGFGNLSTGGGFDLIIGAGNTTYLGGGNTLGGIDNRMREVDTSLILGRNNTATFSAGSLIGGNLNQETNSSLNANGGNIIMGQQNYMSDAKSSAILGGSYSRIISSSDAFIFSSVGATVSGLTHTGVVLLNNFTATQSNTLYTPNLKIIGDLFVTGNTNISGGTSSTQNLQQTLNNGNEAGGNMLSMTSSNIILGTNSNVITGSTISNIFGGFSNTISDSDQSVIINSDQVTIQTGYHKGMILSSFDSVITGGTNSDNSHINNSSECTIENSTYGYINNSQNSYIFDGWKHNQIIGSNVTFIYYATQSTIISTNGATLSNVTNSTIIGLDNVDYNRSHTLYTTRQQYKGTSPTLFVPIGWSGNLIGTDMGGSFSFTTDGSNLGPNTVIAHIFFTDTFSTLSPLVLQPTNQNSAAIRTYIQSSTSSTQVFAIDALTGTTSYSWYYASNPF